jgi:predicted enzyme related to lactoylglutathione lyase
MFLENLVLDAADPQRLGRFWEAALSSQTLADGADGFETRLDVPGGPVLDLCFQPVAAPNDAPPRLHLDLLGGAERDAVVDRLLGLGARHLDIGQGDVPWVVLADPEGHAFCVMEERAAYRDTGPIAAVPIHGSDPERDGAFWASLTGWQPYDGAAPLSLRHPSGRGVILEFLPEAEAKSGKNRLHLDVRLESGDDADEVLADVQERGATRLDHDWGDLPWTVLADPSGNEFCILPARAS